MPSYRDLRAWQLGVELADSVYSATESWPDHERFGMTSQVRRAAVSIPANIAEGRGRWGRKEFRHHVSIANGSLCEVETFLHLAQRRNYLDHVAAQQLASRCEELAKVIWGLMRSLSDETSSRSL
jgi:four helix bundle protein